MKLIILLMLICSIQQVSAKETISFQEYPTLIACYNQDTGEFVTPKNSSVEDGGCLIGRNMKNILLPSKSQMRQLKEVFGSREAIYTAITLINHESQFNSNSKGCHKNGCDYGLFQIRDVNGGKNMTDLEQMKWFKNRKEHQMTVGTCKRTTKKGNHEEILRCIFARHNGVLDFRAGYPSMRLKERNFYKEFLNNKHLKF